MRIIAVFLLGLSGCIGVDYIDDPLVEDRISVPVENASLFPGETFQASAEYYDIYGIRREVNFTWISSNPAVAEVNDSGLVTAKEVGQVSIQPFFGELSGPMINVSVVTDPNAVAIVEITSPSDKVFKGEKLQLALTVKTINGTILTGQSGEWFSENPATLSVNNNGEIEALNTGTGSVYAVVSGIKSNTKVFTIESNIQTGGFTSAGYDAAGTATIEKINNDIILTLSDDFKTEFHIATHIYLANSTNGSEVRAQGVDLGQIFNNGKKTFNITQLKPDIELQDYRYVISLCKPASVTFGFADLK